MRDGDAYVQAGAGIVADSHPAAEYEESRDKARAVLRALEIAQARDLPGSMVLVIDNYDSFTYNLVQYLGELGAEVRVRRNDEITLDEIAALAPDAHRDLAGPGRPGGRGHVDGRDPAVRADGCRCSACASVTRRSGWRSAAASCARRC